MDLPELLPGYYWEIRPTKLVPYVPTDRKYPDSYRHPLLTALCLVQEVGDTVTVRRWAEEVVVTPAKRGTYKGWFGRERIWETPEVTKIVERTEDVVETHEGFVVGADILAEWTQDWYTCGDSRWKPMNHSQAIAVRKRGDTQRILFNLVDITPEYILTVADKILADLRDEDHEKAHDMDYKRTQKILAAKAKETRDRIIGKYPPKKLSDI